MKIMPPAALLASLVLAPWALAQEPTAGAAAPPAAEGSAPAPSAQTGPVPPGGEPSPATGEAVEPEITIREERGQTIYEYRVNGQLYMVRVQPQIGPPYYFLDTKGDGIVDTRSDAPMDSSVNQWILFQWN
jgi:hypothetical protein